MQTGRQRNTVHGVQMPFSFEAWECTLSSLGSAAEIMVCFVGRAPASSSCSVSSFSQASWEVGEKSPTALVEMCADKTLFTMIQNKMHDGPGTACEKSWCFIQGRELGVARRVQTRQTVSSRRYLSYLFWHHKQLGTTLRADNRRAGSCGKVLSKYSKSVCVTRSWLENWNVERLNVAPTV